MITLLFFTSWKSAGFRAAGYELTGSTTRILGVAAFRNRMYKDWDSMSSLNDAPGFSKLILVHTHLNSLVDQRDTWHALVIEIDAPILLDCLVAFICERNIRVVIVCFHEYGKLPSNCTNTPIMLCLCVVCFSFRG